MVSFKNKFSCILLLVGLFASQDLYSENTPLYKKPFKEILANYLFINDFNTKPDTRNVSEHLFWRYDIKIPDLKFPIEHQLTDPAKELPQTTGEGREAQHINEGRVLFLEGNFEEAKNIWLSLRARYGTKYKYHRRNDYFIALAFMNIAMEKVKTNGGNWKDSSVRGLLANAATFLSWALTVKEADHDQLLDYVAPKQFYNLAAIYYTYQRYAGSYGIADKGLNFLRANARKEYRSPMRRILVEAYIRKRSYLDAVKELDVAIRQDPDPKQAAAMFARVGDIYFDLNNYDLAEDAYALANHIDAEAEQINPAQFVLRGESLFWLGRFNEAQKMFHYALESSGSKNSISQLPPDLQAIAHLRLADAYLAENKFKQAKLEYFRVHHEYRGTLQANIARVRNACLELPYFDGNNVMHAREMLEEMKGVDLPVPAQEIGWACQVGSYAQRERTDAMVDRVREFSEKYPESKFLASLVTPVKETKAAQLDEHFAKGNTYSAVSFFEKNRDLLFPKVSEELQQKLFVSYADINMPERAKEFWSSYQKTTDSDLKILRSAAVAQALEDKKDKSKKWSGITENYARSLVKRQWSVGAEPLALNYFNRVASADHSAKHLPWLLKIAKSWAKADDQYTCNLVFPIMTRLLEGGENKTFSLADLKTEISDTVKSKMPKLLAIDETCAVSMLALEFSSLEKDPGILAALYMGRQDWPISKTLVHFFWNASELALAAGKTESARELWRIIRDKGPADAPEVSFAKVRMDNTKHEYDSIWR
jgi:tetratricopeptide (TPR) repeat protein